MALDLAERAELKEASRRLSTSRTASFQSLSGRSRSAERRRSKRGGGQSGAVLGAGVSVDLKFSLFGGLFKSTFPIFAVEPNFFGGSRFCPKCPVAKLTAFGVVFPIPPQ
jgi:hypothetical protein